MSMNFYKPALLITALCCSTPLPASAATALSLLNQVQSIVQTAAQTTTQATQAAKTIGTATGLTATAAEVRPATPPSNQVAQVKAPAATPTIQATSAMPAPKQPDRVAEAAPQKTNAANETKPGDPNFVEMNLMTGQPVKSVSQLEWLKSHPVPKEGCADYLTPAAIEKSLAIAIGKDAVAKNAWQRSGQGICFKRAQYFFYTGVTNDQAKHN